MAWYPGCPLNGCLSGCCSCADRGVGGGVRRQLQRGSADDAAVRLVVLARRLGRGYVPYQCHLHGVRVERGTQQGRAVGDRSHPQARGRIGRLDA